LHERTKHPKKFTHLKYRRFRVIEPHIKTGTWILSEETKPHMEIAQTFFRKKMSILAVDAYPNTQNKLVSSSSSIVTEAINLYLYPP